MARHRSSTTARIDSDGVRIERAPGVRPAVWLIVFASLLLFVGIALRRSNDPNPAQVATLATRSASADSPADGAATNRSNGQRHGAAAVQRPPSNPADDSTEKVNSRSAGKNVAGPNAAPDSGANQAADENSDQAGIGVFPPPGTKPIKRGIVVPDNFELPPGYVRHYQATDDGKQLAPILMFHPDYKPLDENGQPLPLPDDRVVPAEMAPPGMQVRMLDAPDVQVPMVEMPPPDGGNIAP
ncbi:MAG: hypothetical protein HY270_05180 [Deltaproteobacteria bacterium]|nr:hypothetical protein [Deltaproteobacteria bacterium]